MIPLVVAAINSPFSLLSLRIIANIIVTASSVSRQLIDEGILDCLQQFMKEKLSSVTEVPSYYTRWLVLFILSNLAAESEEIVDLLLCSDLYKIIIDEMIDEECNRGLFTEFVYFCSNLVFSSSDEQVRFQ